ncbi:scabin-related ADP-ribosyltransferase [Octadecabacter dasysiphoniae]|uniref:scabin-related ADP-ribosyltransferase n=1 Tax=Octadecabacter dasysiphoniae TaxID=2909341 RepID=UPI003AB9AC36
MSVFLRSSNAPNNADDILPDTVYRGDTRAPDEIFDQGFQPKGPNANVDLEEYVSTTPFASQTTRRIIKPTR